MNNFRVKGVPPFSPRDGEFLMISFRNAAQSLEFLEALALSIRSGVANPHECGQFPVRVVLSGEWKPATLKDGGEDNPLES